MIQKKIGWLESDLRLKKHPLHLTPFAEVIIKCISASFWSLSV